MAKSVLWISRSLNIPLVHSNFGTSNKQIVHLGIFVVGYIVYTCIFEIVYVQIDNPCVK